MKKMRTRRERHAEMIEYIVLEILIRFYSFDSFRRINKSGEKSSLSLILFCNMFISTAHLKFIIHAGTDMSYTKFLQTVSDFLLLVNRRLSHTEEVHVYSFEYTASSNR